MAIKPQYSDGVIAGMQMLYGKGFLSPGGANEVGELIGDFDPSGLHVLDIGCGLGGCALMLAKDHNAASVHGVDIENELLNRAEQSVEEARLTQTVNLQKINPGPLPIDDQTYDLVITKDVVCHVPDKAAMLSDIFRVLKPGGTFLCADFFDASRQVDTPIHAREYYNSYVDGMKTYGLSFYFESQAIYEDALASAGFEQSHIRDHTSNSASVASREQKVLSSKHANDIKDALGEDRFKARVTATDMRLKALKSRGLLHAHIQATKTR